MELAWLEDFSALAESGNFSRAAELRHVTQPAFSRRIRALETWMGTPLFARTAQGAQLTDAGRHVLPAAQEMVRRLHQLRLDAREVAGRATRTLHFAATHSLSFTFFPAWIRQAERGAPLEAVRLLSDSMAVCEQMLLRGQAQFLLCHQHPGVGSALTQGLFRSKGVGADALLPLAVPDVAQAMQAGGDAPYLAYSAESGLGRIVDTVLGQRPPPCPLAPVFHSHLAAVLMSMVQEGKGMAWLPRSLAGEDLSRGVLARGLDAAWDIPLDICLVRPALPMSDFAEAFWEKL
ncbi:Transcriptional regulator [plant metagenome]|uniref:Transcriptional regulator n=2 Tax=root TaxID=1 RepID=A0A1C3JYS9_9BURK|nr:LysR family transcriptional regulator [Orrella dioscoreae]SBT24409.1 Transcriptional regulator [Orrella dioscoreae]SOE47881.1 Transcriptional regulator [Orrella dioscoreae]